MKHIFLALLFIINLSEVSAKVTDTIGFWHIQFNQSAVLQLHLGMKAHVLRIHVDSLDENDLVTIRYSPGCMVCSDCKTFLGVYTQNKKLVHYQNTTGNLTAIELNFRQILIEHEQTDESIFDVYVLAGNKFDPERAVHVLRIELEE
jgi:hypothetical protein